MKTNFFVILAFLFTIQSLAQPSDVSSGSRFGILFMAGGRYDNVRKCVVTPVGTKGGPIADVMLTYRVKLTGRESIRFNLPVMRPLLFAVAFKSLQFEPEMNLLYDAGKGTDHDFFLSPGLGLSLNYITDYNNSADEPRFFSWGPIFSLQTGLSLKKNDSRTFAVRAFYSPLFASSPGKNGTVAGLTLLYWIKI